MRHGRRAHARALAAGLAVLATTAVPHGSVASTSGPPSSSMVDIARAHRSSRSVIVTRDGADAGARDARASGVADLVRSAGDPRDPRSAARAARLLTERFSGYRPPDVRPSDHVRRGEDVVRIALPGGDLDGDGLEDALSMEFRFSAPSGGEWIAMRAYGSSDATELWTVDLRGAWDLWPITGRDLDADGADDVLLYRFDVGPAVGPLVCIPVCAGAGASRTRTTVRALHGPTGATRWMHEVDDLQAVVVTGTPSFLAVNGAAGVVVGTSTAFPAIVGDQNGDGADDVIVNGYAFAWPPAVANAHTPSASVTGSWSEPVVASRAVVLSGATGATLLEREDDVAPGSGAVLVRGGDLTEDGTDDLIWQRDRIVETPMVCARTADERACAGARRYTFSAEAIRGRTFTTIWSKTVVDVDERDRRTAAILLPGDADLTGDDVDDLLLIEAITTGEETDVMQGVVDGADGATVWRARTGAATEVAHVAIPIGSVGGDAAGDLLVMIIGSFERAPAVRLERRDGRTGRIVLETLAHFYENLDAVGLIVTPAGDADADGTLDVVVDLMADDLDWQRTKFSLTRVESGRTGGSLFERRVRRNAFTVPSGPLDGEPGDDILSVGVDRGRLRADVIIEGIGVARGSVRWSRRDGIPVEWAFAIFRSRDHSGDGLDDALYSRAQFRSEFEGFRQFRIAEASRFDGLEGATGELRWGVGDAIPVPSPEGAIAGRITDESGDPAPGCVAVFTTAFDHVGQDIASADGTYRVGGLLDGEYKLAVYDCERHTIEPEWYRDRASFEDADTVSVTGGGDTPGIDIEVTRLS